MLPVQRVTRHTVEIISPCLAVSLMVTLPRTCCPLHLAIGPTPLPVYAAPSRSRRIRTVSFFFVSRLTYVKTALVEHAPCGHCGTSAHAVSDFSPTLFHIPLTRTTRVVTWNRPTSRALASGGSAFGNAILARSLAEDCVGRPLALNGLGVAYASPIHGTSRAQAAAAVRIRSANEPLPANPRIEDPSPSPASARDTSRCA